MPSYESLIIDQYVMYLMLDEKIEWDYDEIDVTMKPGDVDLDPKVDWEWVKQMEDNARKIYPDAKSSVSFFGKYGTAIGGIAVAALLVYLSYKLYKAKYSPASKACANRSGEEKTACMKQYRINALSQQLLDLKQAIKACDKSKDPTKCKAKVNKYIGKVGGKLKKVTV